MNALEVIKRDHTAAEALFDTYKNASEDQKDTVVTDLFKALATHEHMEDKHFYAALNEKVEDDPVLKEIEKEQRELEMETMGFAALELVKGDKEDRIIRMMERVLTHAKKEEAVVFRKAEELLSPEELEELGTKMEPDSAVANS